MKKTSIVFILFFFIALSSFGQVNNEALIKQTFNNYKNAILNDKGDEALAFVDSRTIQYYSDVLTLVKEADSVKVDSLSLLDKLMVFAIRHRTSREDILSFDGKKLLAYAIKSGMVGKSSVADISIGEVKIEMDMAKGQLVLNGLAAPFYFHFYKEDGQWKLDLTSIFTVSTFAFRKEVEDSGLGENEFLFSILHMLTGKKPGNEIWKAVK